MAKPRIFVSSTYYDMRIIRADLERFIKELGYEPVLFERGHVPYGNDKALEDYCYREISTCDIIISIIGGKYGTQSKDEEHSISQKELKTAIDLGKQIYVFVEAPVHSEYRTYQKNKDVEGFKPVSVNDSRVFEFLEEVHGLPRGNPIHGFEVSQDIFSFLKEQWAGLFQRLLQEASRQREITIIEGLKSTAGTLNQLVKYVSEERTKGDSTIKDILLSTHPAFPVIKNILGVPYRVIFYTIEELEDLLSANNYNYDSDSGPDSRDYDDYSTGHGIKVSSRIFDKSGRLKVIRPDEWNDKLITTYSFDSPSIDDDIPF